MSLFIARTSLAGRIFLNEGSPPPSLSQLNYYLIFRIFVSAGASHPSAFEALAA